MVQAGVNEFSALLCCGAGMSSGFLAQRTRAAAKKRGVLASIEARSESEVGSFVNKVDIVLLGPHYEHALKEIQELYKAANTPVLVIPQDIYGSIDGNALLDLIIDNLKK